MIGRVRSVGLLVLVAGLALGGCSSSNREAGNLGTRVCIENQSSRAASVVFTKRDSARGEGPLVAGYQACGEGTKSAGNNDVEGTITLSSPLSDVKVTANNPWFGRPESNLYINGRWCGNAMIDGEKSVWDDGVLRYTVQRLADGQWKEFTVTLAESEQPSASVLPAQCPEVAPL